MVPEQRENDTYIMSLVSDGRYNLNLIQQVRIFIQVVTMADITTITGDKIEEKAFTGKVRESILKWPNQGEPNKAAWSK